MRGNSFVTFETLFSRVRHRPDTSEAQIRSQPPGAGLPTPPELPAPGGHPGRFPAFEERDPTMTPTRAFLLSFAVGLLGLFSVHSLLASALAQPLVVGAPQGPIPTA